MIKIMTPYWVIFDALPTFSEFCLHIALAICSTFRAVTRNRWVPPKIIVSYLDMLCWLQSRSIEAGDALWVAQPLNGSSVYVLDTIIERKRIDDLAASIRDQRYERQKYFLARCGILRTMYVLEGDIDLTFQVLPSTALPFLCCGPN